MSYLPQDPKEYFFAIVDIGLSRYVGGFCVYVSPDRGNPHGDGIPWGFKKNIENATGWTVAEIEECKLEISYTKHIGPNWFNIEYTPIPKEEIIEGLEKLGMTRDLEWEEEQTKADLELEE